MNYTQLRAFHFVATEGGFSAAARRLRLTQPAISQQLRALEREHGVELFHRAGRKVLLTDAGESLLALTRRLFDLEREAGDLLHSLKGLRRGKLRVAADGPYHVIGILAGLRKRYPGLELTVTIGNSRQIRERLLNLESDVAVLAVDPGDPVFHCVPHRKDRIVVFVSASHPWFRRKSIRLQELHRQPMIRRETGSATRAAFDRACEAEGVKPHCVLEIGSREAVREAVAGGMGFGVVSEAEFGHDDRLRPIPIDGTEVFTNEYLLCLADRRGWRAIRAFFEIAAL